MHPSATFSFGGTGTASSTIAQLRGVAFNQATQRLYALSAATPRKIFGLTFGGPGSFTPVGGGFPLEVEPAEGGAPSLTVDNTALASAGHIVYTRGCGCPTSFSDVFSPAGGLLFSINVPPGLLGAAYASGAAVAPDGHIWVSDTEIHAVYEFKPTGGAPIGEIPTPGKTPGDLAFDSSTGDMFLALPPGGVVRLTAASEYSLGSAVSFNAGGNSKLTVNTAANRLYAADEGGEVRVLNASTGSLLETFNGGSQLRDIAVDEATDTVFIGSNSTEKLSEWKPVTVPDVTTGPPVANKKVSGAVGLAGGPEVSECYFEFGTSTSYGSEAKCVPATPYTVDKPLVTAELPGIVEGTTYDYRLVAKNANGIFRGENQTITPSFVASLTTDPASAIEREAATLNGSFEGTGEDTHYYFEWGLTNSYENKTPKDDKGITTGPTPLTAGLTGLTPQTTYYYRVVAENGLGVTTAPGRTFTTSPAVKDVDTGAATEVEQTSATLNGSLDPDGFATTYYFEYGKTTGYGHKAPTTAPPGDPVETQAPSTVPLSKEVAELEPGATYHVRLVGRNVFGTTFGPDETFVTAQPPSIPASSSTEVTASSANLRATINPNGFATTYFFEYGTTDAYGSVAPIPDGVLPATNIAKDVVVPLTGLQEVTYFFRLIAKNKWGTTTTEGQTFDFAPPTGCPNQLARQQASSAYLPDCRAYEIVSPGRAGGSFLFPWGPTSPYASSPARFAFAGLVNPIPGAGNPQGGRENGDLYVASRTAEGWTTRYVGGQDFESIASSGPIDDELNPPHYLGMVGIPSDLTMSKYLVWDRAQDGFTVGGSLKGSYAPYLYDNEGNRIRQLPTNLADVPGSRTDISEGGFTGAGRPSPDFSHYVFSTNDLAFAAGGLLSAPGSVYDNDLTNETVTVVSKTPGGGDIPHDVASGQPDEHIKIPAVSKDGSHILMSTAAAGDRVHLYMTVDATTPYEVSLGQDMLNHGVDYQGMTADGSKVFFTTADQMTADDTDTSVDLYMWSEASDSLTRLSASPGGSGNTDSCTASWTSQCGVEVVPTSRIVFGGGQVPVDSAIASETGEIYFYSPEELDGARGAFGQRNLYVYRNGVARHVATLLPNKPATRIEVTPTGSYMALLTGSRLSSYDNSGAIEMYRYNAATRSFVCTSCRPDGGQAEGQVQGSLNGLFLTDDGRVFFSSTDALVPRDADGVPDVYEYVGGRAQLISSGTSDAGQISNQQIGFVGTSADGTDAFFATVDTLVPQDENGPYLKFYDARTGGGIPYNKPAAPCAAADECHGTEHEAVGPLSIGTAARLGSGGNIQPVKRKACKKHRRCRHKKKRKSSNRQSGSRRHG